SEEAEAFFRYPGVSGHHTIGRMAYDEDLADRIRELLSPQRGVTEKKMFGGSLSSSGATWPSPRAVRAAHSFGSTLAKPIASSRPPGRAGSGAWSPDAGLAPRRVRRPAHQASAREVGKAGLGVRLISAAGEVAAVAVPACS